MTPLSSITIVYHSSHIRRRLYRALGTQTLVRRKQRISERAKERTIEWADERTNEWTNGRTEERKNGRTHERRNERLNERTDKRRQFWLMNLLMRKGPAHLHALEYTRIVIVGPNFVTTLWRFYSHFSHFEKFVCYFFTWQPPLPWPPPHNVGPLETLVKFFVSFAACWYKHINRQTDR